MILKQFKTGVAFAITLSTALLALSACDGLINVHKPQEKINGLTMALFLVGAPNTGGDPVVKPDMTIVFWADLTAKISCGGCHGRTPVFNAGAFATYAGASNCTASGYTSSPLYKQLLPGRMMYNYDSAISNHAIPFIAGWIANGCRP
jgi:hypothetical protein